MRILARIRQLAFCHSQVLRDKENFPRHRHTCQFDLAAEFDINQYLHILADSVEGVSEVSDADELDRELRIGLKAAADSVAPQEDEWSSWGN